MSSKNKIVLENIKIILLKFKVNISRQNGVKADNSFKTKDGEIIILVMNTEV